MIDDSGGWHSIGAHQVHVEPPDLLFVRDRGDVSTADAAGILDEVRKLSAVGGPIRMLNDIAGMGDVPAEVWRVFARSDLLSHVRAMGIFGGSFPQRVLATLIVTAARLGYRGSHLPPIRFFGTEAEARAWLEAARGDSSGLSGA
ncbi:MAG: STAS/SEC14 domain-containing protein [Polyangiaceae bacterium]|nr:STAS/SEC14 domain-containing protein [Polyangiaceae bacterium]